MELGRVFCGKSVYRLWQGKEDNPNSEYYMMLFTVYYEGKGFPIAIVECMKSDVPVIASNRHFNSGVCLEYAKLFESGAVTDVVYKIVED